jgi:Bacteriophage probable baseplate hub protein
VTQASSTSNLFAIQRPSFTVDGKEQPRLAEMTIRFEVVHDEEGMARLELTLLNWGIPKENADPDFLWFDGQVLDFGREIRVSVGDGDNRAEVFAGFVTSLEAVYAELDPPEVVVRAEDALQWARMRVRSHLHENSSDAAIAADVADSLGLPSSLAADGPTHHTLLQLNQSELAFLRERARAVNARIAVEDGALVFRARREPAPPEPIPLARSANLSHFEARADLAHQRTSVQVHGYSVEAKKGIHEEAGQAAVQGELDGGRSGTAILEQIGVDAPEHLHLEAPATTDEALALAEACYRRRARRFVCGHGITDGTPGLRVGSRVELLELGPWFDGIYHVNQVRHAYDQEQGLRTHFGVERPGLGGRA